MKASEEACKRRRAFATRKEAEEKALRASERSGEPRTVERCRHCRQFHVVVPRSEARRV